MQRQTNANQRPGIHRRGEQTSSKGLEMLIDRATGDNALCNDDEGQRVQADQAGSGSDPALSAAHVNARMKEQLHGA
jgi:hypothetical protein